MYGGLWVELGGVRVKDRTYKDLRVVGLGMLT